MDKTQLIKISDLSVSFRQSRSEKQKGDAHIVRNVSLDIKRNETLALVGESGSGKSLTALSILRLLPYPKAYHPSGKILLDGEDLLALPLDEMTRVRGKKISMIFQEPMTALNPLHTIGKQLQESVAYGNDANEDDVYAKCINLLEQVKLKDPQRRFNAYPHQLSGGQRQRVMIAMAIANKPDLLIADEPTTALDVTTQKEILDLLKGLQEEHKLSILLITHDLSVVQYMADRVMVMRHGEVVEEGSCEQIMSSPSEDYTQELINASPSGKPVDVTINTQALPLLVAKDLTVTYAKDKPFFGKSKNVFHALKSLNLDLPAGITLGVLGESGSGKSTLALALLKLIRSDGDVQFNGQEISGLKEKAMMPIRRDIQIVFQDPFSSLSPRMSIAQIIGEGLTLESQLSPTEVDQRIEQIMQEVGLDVGTKHRYPHELSGGQRQRVSIARAMILNPKLVFLDEPTSALDRVVQLQIIELLRKLQTNRKLTYVFISHDLQVVKTLSHQVMVLKGGEVVEAGDAEQIFNSPQHSYTQKLLSASLH